MVRVWINYNHYTISFQQNTLKRGILSKTHSRATALQVLGVWVTRPYIIRWLILDQSVHYLYAFLCMSGIYKNTQTKLWAVWVKCTPCELLLWKKPHCMCGSECFFYLYLVGHLTEAMKNNINQMKFWQCLKENGTVYCNITVSFLLYLMPVIFCCFHD